jgi:alkanesulfonate monooxygenase SsuD/methylene tetrahydromethanopterin reductase-like flavin-dependent oxidoreductase (luciferase family)
MFGARYAEIIRIAYGDTLADAVINSTSDFARLMNQERSAVLTSKDMITLFQERLTNLCHQQLIDQVTAFTRGKAAAGRPLDTRLSLQRGMFLVDNEKDKRHIAEKAWTYYQSFDNVFGGAGIVDKGIIRPLPRAQSVEELASNLLLCGKDEMIERIAVYSDLGIDEVLTTSNFGQDEQMTLDMMSRFAEEVMPHFEAQKKAA